MTPAQADAMDAVSHMTAQEIKEFAEMLMKELEKKMKQIQAKNTITSLKIKQILRK